MTIQSSSLTAVDAGSRKAVITGRILSGFAAAFMLFDLSGKLFMVQQTVEGTVRLGYTADVLVPLGVIQLVILALYLIPRTAVVGAVLMTGYLGGAVASHVRAHGSAFEITFPILFAAMLWGGLYLRDARVAAMISATGRNR
jgi:hypothetical protein